MVEIGCVGGVVVSVVGQSAAVREVWVVVVGIGVFGIVIVVVIVVGGGGCVVVVVVVGLRGGLVWWW